MSKPKMPAVADYITSRFVRRIRSWDSRHKYVDLDESAQHIIRKVDPYTLTAGDRIAALCTSVDYIVDHGIPGAIVECGVWRGGSLLAMVLRLLERGITDRDVFGYDVWQGMGPSGFPYEPTDEDVLFNGASVKNSMNPGRIGKALYEQVMPRVTHFQPSRDDVFGLLTSAGYPSERIHLVAGPVEDTLPAQAPETIALLRLDTDLYESTRHELEHLYPRIPVGGVLVIDDYGYWKGARKAVDDYFDGHRILLHRDGPSVRFAVKQQER
ncbi:TylF/MycF/NovP-related O-methyltransferase [Mycobacterium sp. NPDC051804]|uniref:TylF/MycF/NovP-related O-methyltransferase n=1 Tax=Mycobacterium sp. NPDC051804 TaxID=3364295 RepID=UPI0037947A78